MLAVAALAVASCGWAADTFISVITGAHLLAGFCLLWAASQLVRSWDRLRLVAAICFGLLLTLVAQSTIYCLIDVPENTRYWNEHKDQILKEHNWRAGSFAATQFEHKVVSGEIPSFFNSANTFAAVGVMLFAVAAGIGIQRIKDKEGAAAILLAVIAAAGAAWIIYLARSKTAGATPVLGVGMLVAVAMLRPRLKRHSVAFYWLGVAACFGGMIAVAGHGLYHGGLFPGHFSNSLDFRWKYWVASVRVFLAHPLLGVGWSNFGLHYMAARLPEASEEIKDPHNFLIRFFAELGITGGGLVVAWLLRMWWEMTRPTDDAAAAAEATGSKMRNAPVISSADRDSNELGETVVTAAMICIAGIMLTILVNVDFSQSAADVTLEMLRRVLYLLALLLGTIAGAMISPHKRELDGRPAPWLIYCMMIAMGLFLIHNLIDFSLFEAGPMFVFLMVAGSVLGVAPARESRRGSGAIAIAGAIAAIGGMAAAVVVFGIPVIEGEQAAFEAGEFVRSAPENDGRQQAAHYQQAADSMRFALDHIPYNADYAFDLSRYLLGSGHLQDAEDMIARTIRLNPMMIAAYLDQANVELRKPSPDAALVEKDFEAILRLNPNDVALHRQFGEALDRFGEHQRAQAQYELALRYNSLLPPDEPKRLSAEEIAAIQRRIDADKGRADGR